MKRQVKCSAATSLRGTSDDEVAVTIRAQLRADHADLVGKISDDDIWGWIEVVG